MGWTYDELLALPLSIYSELIVWANDTQKK